MAMKSKSPNQLKIQLFEHVLCRIEEIALLLDTVKCEVKILKWSCTEREDKKGETGESERLS